MDTKEIKGNTRTQIDTVVVINHGVISGTIKGYVYCPKVHFGGGTVKWFDDRKLVKGGAR